jgi:hypothetical protein
MTCAGKVAVGQTSVNRERHLSVRSLVTKLENGCRKGANMIATEATKGMSDLQKGVCSSAPSSC